jgi:hypothetical protein
LLVVAGFDAGLALVLIAVANISIYVGARRGKAEKMLLLVENLLFGVGH